MYWHLVVGCIFAFVQLFLSNRIIFNSIKSVALIWLVDLNWLGSRKRAFCSKQLECGICFDRLGLIIYQVESRVELDPIGIQLESKQMRAYQMESRWDRHRHTRTNPNRLSQKSTIALHCRVPITLWSSFSLSFWIRELRSSSSETSSRPTIRATC